MQFPTTHRPEPVHTLVGNCMITAYCLATAGPDCMIARWWNRGLGW
jgi:hypothetical protein